MRLNITTFSQLLMTSGEIVLTFFKFFLAHNEATNCFDIDEPQSGLVL
jgi:hypothetical protein